MAQAGGRVSEGGVDWKKKFAEWGGAPRSSYQRDRDPETSTNRIKGKSSGRGKPKSRGLGLGRRLGRPVL